MKKNRQHVLIGIGIAFLLYNLVGFLLVPFGMERVIRSRVAQDLNAVFQAESVRFNPYTLEVRILKAVIDDGKNDAFLSVDALSVNLSAASIFKLAPVISNLSIDGPKAVLVLDKDGNFGFPGRPLPGKPAQENETASSFLFSLSNLELAHATLVFKDLKHKATHGISDLMITAPLISNLDREAPSPVVLRASALVGKAPVTMDASIALFAPGMQAQTQVIGKDLDLTPFMRYLTVPEGLVLPAPGRMSWDLDLSYDQEKATHRIGLKGYIGLAGVEAALKDGSPLARIPEIRVDVDTDDLLRKGFRISKAEVKTPELFLVRDAAGDLALAKAMGTHEAESLPEEKPKTETGDKGLAVTLDRATLDHGILHFKDDAVENGFQARLSPVSIEITAFRFQGQDLSFEIKGEIQTERQEKLRISGRMAGQGDVLDIKGQFSLENALPQTYAVYTRPFTGPDLSMENLSAAASVFLTRQEGQVQGRIADGTLNLARIRLAGRQGGPDLIDLPVLNVAGIDLDPVQHILKINAVETEKGTIRLSIDKDGRIDLQDQLESLLPKKKDGEPESPPWQVALGKMSLTDWAVGVDDRRFGKDPVHLALSQIHVQAANLDTAGEPGQVLADMVFQDGGQIGIKGALDLTRKNNRLDLDLKNIDVRTFQPYLDQYLELSMTKGFFQAKGVLSLAGGSGSQGKVTYQGQAGLTDFSSKGRVSGIDFFRCESLFLSGMDITPERVEIKDISLTDFYHRALLLKTGQFNYKAILGKQDPAPDTAGQTEMPSGDGTDSVFPFHIQNITLQGGHVNFTDLFTNPNYTANMTQIAGSITGLTSMGDVPADLTLKGVHGLYSPLDITGKIHPFGQERTADVNLAFKNIELTQFNAYAQKYLGYEIETGKLVLNLDYHVQGTQLASENRLFFDRLDLGKKVDSPDATSLPIQLALSLLKNRKGQIDLDIPLDGDLNDPRFSFGSVVGEAFKNLVLKVVAAPFKVIGRLFGGWDSDELGYVAFAPGTDQMDDRDREKLDHLCEILSQKKKLFLKVKGTYDPEQDIPVLRLEHYEEMLISMSGQKDGTEDKRILENPGKRNRLVEKAYEQATFPKPMDDQGREKEVSPEEQATLLLTHTVVTDEMLLELASRRSQQVIDHIISTGKLDPERVFAQASDKVSPEEKDSQSVKTIFALE